LIHNEARIKKNENADRALGHLHEMNSANAGFKNDRYQHSLQTATRSFNGNTDNDEMTVGALVHGFGKLIT